MRAREIMNESEYIENFPDAQVECVFEAGRRCPYHEDLEEDLGLGEAKASRALCLSTVSNAKLGRSMYSSCVAQGLRAHTGDKKARVGDRIIKLAGKKVKSAKYGGPLKQWPKKKKE